MLDRCREATVWQKPNAMPQSVCDRMSNRYELIFLLVKQQRYWFDLDPVVSPTPATAHSPDAPGEAG